MKYCCEKFEFDVNVNPTTAPNIRIVQFTPKEGWDTKKLYIGYFLTLGYEKFDILKVVIRHIAFCPYCGIDLKNFYKSKEYCNEIEGVTF